jgi:integrase
MMKYCHVTGLTPTQAIEEADEDEENGIRLRRRRLVQHLEDFEDFLEENYQENTIKSSIAFVRSFYQFNEIIELPRSKRKIKQKEYITDVKKLPGTADIKKAIIHCQSVKYKAIIILLASNGMRQGDLRRLKIKQFVQALNNYIKEDDKKIGLKDLSDITHLRKKIPKNIGPLRWDFVMQKSRRKHTTFSTPESLEYLLSYLETRTKIESLEEYIFPGKRGNNKRIRTQSINFYFNDLNSKCKFPITPIDEPIFFRPHNLRKWFGNQLKKTELGYIETRLLLGHRVMDDTGSRYLVPDFEDLFQKYYRNLDAVTLFGKVEVVEVSDEKVQGLEDRISHLERLLDDREREDGLP